MVASQIAPYPVALRPASLPQLDFELESLFVFAADKS
jgi:hypothetical protein